MCVCVCVLAAQSCPTLCNSTDCSPPGSSVHGISQARILEWVAISFSRESQPRNWTHVSYIGMQIFYHWATWETLSRFCTVRLEVFSLFFAFVFYVYIISVKSIINLLKYSTIQLSVLVEYLGSLTYCINVRSWKLAGLHLSLKPKENINPSNDHSFSVQP